jgi:hypothetical protein
MNEETVSKQAERSFLSFGKQNSDHIFVDKARFNIYKFKIALFQIWESHMWKPSFKEERFYVENFINVKWIKTLLYLKSLQPILTSSKINILKWSVLPLLMDKFPAFKNLSKFIDSFGIFAIRSILRLVVTRARVQLVIHTNTLDVSASYSRSTNPLRRYYLRVLQLSL